MLRLLFHGEEGLGRSLLSFPGAFPSLRHLDIGEEGLGRSLLSFPGLQISAVGTWVDGLFNLIVFLTMSRRTRAMFLAQCDLLGHVTRLNFCGR